jgi:D-3-phosphoglycerate dehydrogenase
VIGRAGVGIDNVDVDAATRRGIVVANAPESTVVSAAEHTIGCSSALARNIPQAHAALKQGRWERKKYGGIELADKTLGVLGFGRIGQQVARRGAGSACASSRTTRSSRRALPRARRRAVESRDDVLRAAEFLTLHLPLTDETRGSSTREAFAKMRDGVRIVNARAASSSTRTRCSSAALGEGRGRGARRLLARAVLRPLLELDNVVVTPHLAASTEEAQDRAGVIVASRSRRRSRAASSRTR